ncbi:hypothetical protein HUG15_10435 [Salicibibacter cibarius]|uniref:Uncharacterized protein n=1 Tax=Salicibibacter cibarius TaxID=2743000 RepID=A0A7T7CBK8_9BACI|nr:hypothetical protein HUG15_10435 [Salicibibacter cibarius]
MTERVILRGKWVSIPIKRAQREDLAEGARLIVPLSHEGNDQASIVRLHQLQLTYTTCEWFAGFEETASAFC